MSYFYEDTRDCNAEIATEIEVTNTTHGICKDIFSEVDDHYYFSEDHSYELTTITVVDHSGIVFFFCLFANRSRLCSDSLSGSHSHCGSLQASLNDSHAVTLCGASVCW